MSEKEDKKPCSECGNLSLMIMGRSRRRALLEVSRERDRQENKWGKQNHDAATWMAILGEEFGEACQAALHDRFGGKAAGTLRDEVVQIAAVAVQMLERLP